MPDGTRRNGPGYDEDFYAWTQYQAEVLRSMPCDDNRFDREHVAEEIEDLGRNTRDAVRSQVRRILVHFLKLAYSPAGDPRYGWRGSIIDARTELADKLSPTLRQDLSTSLDKVYAAARKRVASDLEDYGEQEAAASLPADCPYTLAQILEHDWYPELPVPEET
ncbi:MAG: DUF29 domain-containing protein [Alphaproteobacteria bacterium]